MQNVSLDEVTITGGFWQDRQDINRKVSLKLLWDRATNDEYGYSLNNFKVAAEVKEGTHQGVPARMRDSSMFRSVAVHLLGVSSGFTLADRRMKEVGHIPATYIHCRESRLIENSSAQISSLSYFAIDRELPVTR